MRVVATAGHVDHGKSSLVEALTGTNPDRLEEERSRGMTIDLGFAHTMLPSGAGISFVDVPGPDGPTTMVATPVDFAGTPWAPRGPAPDLGEHSRDILRELGHDEAAIDALFASGAAHSRAWFG